MMGRSSVNAATLRDQVYEKENEVCELTVSDTPSLCLLAEY